MIIVYWKNIVFTYLFFLIFTTLVMSLFGKTGFAAIPYIRAGYVIPLLVLIFAYILNQKFKLKKLSRGGYSHLITYFSLISPIWAMVGVTNGFYFVTDVLYFLVFILLYIVLTNSIVINGVTVLCLSRFIYKCSILMSLSLVLFKVCGYHLPGILYIFIFICWILSLFSGINDFFDKQSIFQLFTLIISLSDLNRAFFLQSLIILILCYLVFFDVKRKVLYFVLFFIFLIFLSFIFKNDYLDMFNGTPLGRRINETLVIFDSGINEETSIPMIQRMYESKMVLYNLSLSPIHYIFGYGFGATLDMSSSIDTSVTGSQLMGGGKTHNIHFIHMAVLYRYGILGVFLYLYLIFSSIYNFLNIKNDFYNDKNEIFSASFGCVYPIALFVFSSTASSTIFVDPILPFSMVVYDYVFNQRNVKYHITKNNITT